MEGARTGFLTWFGQPNAAPPARHTKLHTKLQREAMEATPLSPPALLESGAFDTQD